MAEIIRRYTSLPYALHLLSSRQLTLLNPSSWNDRNDAVALERYRSRQGLGGLLALCLTGAAETSHHWSTFSASDAGVCITFHKDRLLSCFEGIDGLRYRQMRYLKIQEVRGAQFELDEIPFIKRSAFADENEFRLIYERKLDGKRDASEKWVGDKLVAKEIPIRLEAIADVVFCSALPDSVYGSCKALVAAIPGCERIRLLRTTLLQNSEWLKNIERKFDSGSPGM